DLTAALPNHVSALEQKLRATSEDQLPALHAVLPMSVLAKYWRLPSPAASRRLLAVTASPSTAVLILQIAFRILSHTSAGTGPSSPMLSIYTSTKLGFIISGTSGATSASSLVCSGATSQAICRSLSA